MQFELFFHGWLGFRLCCRLALNGGAVEQSTQLASGVMKKMRLEEYEYLRPDTSEEWCFLAVLTKDGRLDCCVHSELKTVEAESVLWHHIHTPATLTANSLMVLHLKGSKSTRTLICVFKQQHVMWWCTIFVPSMSFSCIFSKARRNQTAETNKDAVRSQFLSPAWGPTFVSGFERNEGWIQELLMQ